MALTTCLEVAQSGQAGMVLVAGGRGSERPLFLELAAARWTQVGRC